MKNEVFQTVDAANECVSRFYDGAKKLREECGMSDVLYVMRVQVMDGIDGPRDAYIVGQIGSQVEMESMAAYCMGQIQAERQEMIAKAIDSAKKRVLKPDRER